MHARDRPCSHPGLRRADWAGGTPERSRRGSPPRSDIPAQGPLRPSRASARRAAARPRRAHRSGAAWRDPRDCREPTHGGDGAAAVGRGLSLRLPSSPV
ncbi:MAG: hypothetical protein EOO66_30735 [Methylobacterium sp.]|nr:MAG: hypothetical protein EOO66_30735 [Methylobacterium sp.]